MGYHVSLINTSSKINYEECIRIFKKFNIEILNDDEKTFYHLHDQSFILFYTDDFFWVNTTDDRHIKYLIDIASYLNDGTRVVGGQGETYRSINETYIHPDDVDDSEDESLLRYFLRINKSILIMIMISLIILSYMHYVR